MTSPAVARESADVVVIGGGQAGLAAGYYLRRAGLDFVILDRQSTGGGAWQHAWDSLRLFSPAAFSPLPGWWMPAQTGESYPTASHVVDYLRAYEQRYDLPIRRPVVVRTVRDAGERLVVETDTGQWSARAVVSATGTWGVPYVPDLPGHATFAGEQLHTVDYRDPNQVAGQRVVVAGGGNSGAQVVADLAGVADVVWATARPPRLMPDDVDGRVLFDVATQAQHGVTSGVGELGDIVVIPPVRAARDAGRLTAVPMFERLTESGVVWSDGEEQRVDTIIWCTGFRPDLAHLHELTGAAPDTQPQTEGTRWVQDPRLHLIGYGDWTGRASATLIGAGRTAKSMAREVQALVGSSA